MPGLGEYPSSGLVKALYLGDAGAGKTSSIVSLVKAGYKVRILDLDNLLSPLIEWIKKECPENIGNARAVQLTDKMKAISTPVIMNGGSAKVMPFINGTPVAFTQALALLTQWKEPDGTDLGDPGSWGPDTVVVIDTLTTLADSAFRYAQAMNPAGKEQQAYYFTAQQLIINMLSLLCSKDFATHVLVLAHIDYTENQFNVTRGFPRSIGSALNQKLGAYFNSVLLAEKVGSKRQLRTNNAGLVDLKNPVSFSVPETLPLESGLATFFAAVRK